MDNKICSILVSSCDSYEDVWSPFFSMFKIMWKDCPFDIYLNTETLDYKHEGFDIKCLHPKSKEDSWSSRLKQALLRIDSKYILFFLEDFFIKQPVRVDMIENCINWMEKDEKVVFIDFYHDKTENDIIVEKEFSEIERKNDWAINANCALWRKSFLIDILRDENPWDFEMNATARWRRTDYKIYTHRKEFDPIVDYQFETINLPWSGIIKGKWLSTIPELFEKYGVEVDYSKRGLIDPPDMRGRKREKNWFLHDVGKALKSPKKMAHYVKCTFDVLKDKKTRLWRRFFNR